MKSLVEFYPELVEEWDYEKNVVSPSEVSYGSHKKFWWKCNEGHNWETKVYMRTTNGSKCPYCVGHKVSNKNSLAIKHPELAKEWDYEKNALKPEEVSYGSEMKVWWKCHEGHSWKASPNSRTGMKTGCPGCRKNKLLNKNSLVIKYPELLEEWDYEKNALKPEELSYGSIKKVWWKCKEGHSWQATPNSRTNMKSGCYYCSGKGKKG